MDSHPVMTASTKIERIMVIREITTRISESYVEQYLLAASGRMTRFQGQDMTSISIRIWSNSSNGRAKYKGYTYSLTHTAKQTRVLGYSGSEKHFITIQTLPYMLEDGPTGGYKASTWDSWEELMSLRLDTVPIHFTDFNIHTYHLEPSIPAENH